MCSGVVLCSVVVYFIGNYYCQLHSAKVKLRFCTGLNLARGESEVLRCQGTLTVIPFGNKAS